MSWNSGSQNTARLSGVLPQVVRIISSLASGAPGDRVLIVCPQSLDYVSAFFGCLYGGFIAVPAYAPRNNHHFARLSKIIEDARPRAAQCGEAR